MRLITHNLLKCNIRGVDNGYPLIIEGEKIDIIEFEYSKEMIDSISKKIDFNALKSAAANLRIESKIYEISSQEEFVASLSNQEISRDVHNLLFQVHVTEGYLICPVSDRRFPVKDGIPNMLLHEDEV